MSPLHIYGLVMTGICAMLGGLLWHNQAVATICLVTAALCALATGLSIWRAQRESNQRYEKMRAEHEQFKAETQRKMGRD